MTSPAPSGPAVHRQPPPVGRLWILALALGVVAVFAAWFGPLQILLPAQADRLSGNSALPRESILALVTGVGAAVSMVANLLWGLSSDRCRVRFGSRTPVAVAGALVGSAGLVLLFLAESTSGMVAGWAVAQFGFNGPFAVLAALISDQAPERQRGVVGSLFGVGQIVGVIGGTAVAAATGGQELGYLVLAVGAPALLAAIVLTQRGREREREADRNDPGGPSDPTDEIRGLAAFRPSADFCWAWALRFAMNLTNAVVLLYMYFFLDEVVGVSDPENGVLVVTVVTLVLAAACAAGFGMLSDRLGRRRVFALAGALVTAVGFVILASASTMTHTLVAAALIGVGWGAFITVDMAIMTSVLTTTRTAGTMLGAANVANALPQVVAPLIAAPLALSSFGYSGLYIVTAVIAVVAALLTFPIRSVR